MYIKDFLRDPMIIWKDFFVITNHLFHLMRSSSFTLLIIVFIMILSSSNFIKPSNVKDLKALPSIRVEGIEDVYKMFSSGSGVIDASINNVSETSGKRDQIKEIEINGNTGRIRAYNYASCTLASCPNSMYHYTLNDTWELFTGANVEVHVRHESNITMFAEKVVKYDSNLFSNWNGFKFTYSRTKLNIFGAGICWLFCSLLLISWRYTFTN